MTSTFIVLSSIVKSPIKCLSFFPYRFISLAPPRSGSGTGSGERGGRCVPGPLGAAGTAPRTGLGCGTRAGHSIISAGTRGCLGGCLGAGSVALVPRCAAPPLRSGPRAAAGTSPVWPAWGAGGRGLVPGAVPDPASLSFLPRVLGAVVLEGKERSRAAPSPPQARRCDGAGAPRGSRRRVSLSSPGPWLRRRPGPRF